jgi:peptidoglycan biosynthesis protein MviN/MurJ (putative lipid II flippase)
MPAAFSLSSIMSVVLLGYLLYKNNRECAPRKIPQYLFKSLICAIVSAIALYFIQKTGWDSSSKIIQLVILAVKSAIGMCVYFSVALLLQMKEPIYVLDKIKRPFQRR